MTAEKGAPACPNLRPMADWLKEGGEEACRPCLLPVTIAWYCDELKARGHPDLAAELETVRKSGDSSRVCETMDSIKERVPPELRERLEDFDCATQNFNPDEVPEEA